MSSEATVYDRAFYQGQIGGARTSAKLILATLYESFLPASVVDVGCGQGAWLAAARDLGSTTLQGYDGPWISASQFACKEAGFVPVDLSAGFEIPRRYDLCISLEVAEHLPPGNETPFIATLCGAADVVLFSAAIPYQGGVNHINEQWQSAWVSRFDAEGYQCIDSLRSSIWGLEAVEWWYRQNLLLFVNRARHDLVASLDQLPAGRSPVYDLVHPLNYEEKARKAAAVDRPSLRFCLGCLKRYVVQSLSREPKTSH